MSGIKGTHEGCDRQKLEQNKINTILGDIKKLMKNAQWTAKQAMDTLEISASEQPKYLAQL